MDRKIIGGLNYCYGDKCRSGKPDFCFGASEMTDNPFGCHRLQISAFNHPWWSFGSYDSNGIWHVDKDAIWDRINQYSLPYKQCPSFSMQNIFLKFNSLPDKINPDSDNKWIRYPNGIQPSKYITSINAHHVENTNPKLNSKKQRLINLLMRDADLF